MLKNKNLTKNWAGVLSGGQGNDDVAVQPPRRRRVKLDVSVKFSPKQSDKSENEVSEVYICGRFVLDVLLCRFGTHLVLNTLN